MPIEIRELHIKVTVNEQAQGPENARLTTAQTDSRESRSSARKEEIVAECVEKVLEIMRNKSER